MLDNEVKFEGAYADVWELIVGHRYFEAKRKCADLLKKNKGDMQAIAFLGYIYVSEWDTEKARNCFQHIVEREPANVSAWSNLALALSRGGYMSEALSIWEKIKDKDAQAYSNMLLNYCNIETDHVAMLERHRGYCDAHARKDNSDVCYGAINERLRIAIISDDFNSHAVSNFLRPIVRNAPLYDFDVYLYRDGGQTDLITKEFETSAHYWKDVSAYSNDALDSLIISDGIDILLDVTGHTNGGKRLQVYAGRPAPCQITYMGYPFSTGTDYFDARIVDNVTDPDFVASEKLVKLNRCFLCYCPPNNWIPASEYTERGRFAFGSFARIEKITDHVVELWSKILVECPDAILALKAMAYKCEEVKNRLKNKFAAHGVAPERVYFLPWAPSVADHLKAFNYIDVTLDTFPYNGTTITCESLAMGVPVVTMPGEPHYSRVSKSILEHAGLYQSIANNASEYVAAASHYYGVGQRTIGEREALMSMFASSNVCDEHDFAQRFFREVEAIHRECVSGAVNEREAIAC